MSAKVSANHRKSTQVRARPGQTESQVDPSFQLATTCDSIWPALNKTVLHGAPLPLPHILFWRSEPHLQNFFNFAKSCISSCLSKFFNKKEFHGAFLKYNRLKLKIRAFLAGNSVAMVTYSVTKIIPTCSPMIGQSFFDTMIVTSTD